MNTTPAQSAPELPVIIARPLVLPVTRVIAGVDGSAGSAAALRWAAAEACRRQVLLRIVSAWEEPDRTALPPPVIQPGSPRGYRKRWPGFCPASTIRTV